MKQNKRGGLMDVVEECTHDFDGKPIDRRKLIARLEADQEVINKVKAGLLTSEQAIVTLVDRVMKQQH